MIRLLRVGPRSAVGAVVWSLALMLAGSVVPAQRVEAGEPLTLYWVVGSGLGYAAVKGLRRESGKDLHCVMRPWRHLNQVRNHKIPIELSDESMTRLYAAAESMVPGRGGFDWWSAGEAARTDDGSGLYFKAGRDEAVPAEADIIGLEYREDHESLVFELELAGDIGRGAELGELGYAYWGIVGERPRNRDVISNAFAVFYAPGLRILNEPGCYLLVTTSKRKPAAERRNRGLRCEAEGARLRISMPKSELPEDHGRERRFLFMTGELLPGEKPVQNLLKIVGVPAIER